MFLDERVNSQTNKIFSKAILYATIISTLYLMVKTYVFGLSFAGSISELFIIITGIGIVVLDISKFKTSDYDERIEEKRMEFYNKASVTFLGMSLLGFALAIPIYLLKMNETPPINILFINLELLGFIYFSYQFKKNRIYFNYSFIENETGYYKSVLKNILKLTFLTSMVYGFALFISLIIFMTKTSMIAIVISVIISFIISLLSLSLYYFLISWMERMTYKSLLNGSKRLGSQLIIGGLYIIASAFSFYITYLIRTIDHSYTINIGQRISYLINMSNWTTQTAQLLLVMLLSNILLQFKQKVKGVGIIIFSMMMTTIISLLTVNIGYLDMFNDTKNFEMLHLITTYISLIFYIVSSVGFLILTVFFIKNKMSKIRILIPIIGFVIYIFNLGVKDLFDNNQQILMILSVVYSCIYVFSLVKIVNDETVLFKDH
ncbi:hypothetical protein [Acholeplasma laidlawii]|uniref:hypothetical protein n=1 Tax=Acholeplasma laidlawii TaxID=2148 RepID=UPI0021F7BAC8|nr:hypothetical protein [Acholeplasma laidlawii]